MLSDKVLLHMRYEAARGGTAHHRRGPQIEDGELATAHFVVTCSRGKDIRKWLIISVDTDQYIKVLLAMAMSDICPAGEDRVDVTVKRIANSETEYEFVSSV